MFGKRTDIINTSFIPVGRDASQKRITDMKTKHDIVGAATRAGQKNEPNTNDRDVNGDQRAIFDESIGFGGVMTRRASADLTQSANEMRALTPAPFDAAMARSNLRLQSTEIKELYRDELDRANFECQISKSALLAFEVSNGLKHLSAIYKPDFMMFTTALFGLLLGESIFNAFSFEELQDRGLFGGLLMATSVGVANVMMGLGTGYFGWRLAVHKKPGLRLLGLTITFGVTAAALALHLALGDLREAISHNVKAQIDFLVILKPWRWFAYTSISPFVLFTVGMGTFVIAALKGRGGNWGVVAPYWMHEHYDRRYREAERALADAKYNLRAALQNAYDGELAKLRAGLESETANVVRIRQLLAQSRSIAQSLSDSIREELDRLHIWLRCYRESNCAVRTTPPPAYFGTYPDFDELRVPRLDMSEVEALAQNAEQVLAKNRASLAEFQERTLDEQTASLEALLTLVASSERRVAQQISRDEQPSSNRA